MVTKEEMESMNFTHEMELMPRKGIMQVSKKEMGDFDRQIADLRLDIARIIDEYAQEHNIKPKYEGMEERTHLSAAQIKQLINGRANVTRTSLYKLAVGLKMTVEEANEKLFKKFNGELRSICREDFICIKALEDGDDVSSFIREYNTYTKGNKLKDPLA